MQIGVFRNRYVFDGKNIVNLVYSRRLVFVLRVLINVALNLKIIIIMFVEFISTVTSRSA